MANMAGLQRRACVHELCVRAGSLSSRAVLKCQAKQGSQSACKVQGLQKTYLYQDGYSARAAMHTAALG